MIHSYRKSTYARTQQVRVTHWTVKDGIRSHSTVTCGVVGPKGMSGEVRECDRDITPTKQSRNRQMLVYMLLLYIQTQGEGECKV